MPEAFRPLSSVSPHPVRLSRVLGAALKREWCLQVRRRGDLINPLLFFALVTILFPLGVSPVAEVLAPVASGVLWVAALLATLLSLDALFRPDLLDGSLEQWVVSGQPVAPLALAKVMMHWLLGSLPLIVLAPFLGMMLFLPWSAVPALMAALFLGTGVLALVGAIGAALTAGLGKSGVLLTLMVLPLYIPVLILGTQTVQYAVAGHSPLPTLALLMAMWVVALMLAPWAIAASLKVVVQGQ